MAIIDLANGAIGYEETGGGAAVPIVFLHGVGSTKEVWRPQLDHFGRDRRAVAFDYPGYGESVARPGVGRDGFAAAIVEAMDALGIGRAHVCGLSLGGVVAIALHALAPGRVETLVLADSFAFHPEGRAIAERSVGAARAVGMRALAEARVPSLVGHAATPALVAALVETMAGIDVDAYAQAADAVWLADQSARAAAIALPTLVLCGAEDAITPPALSEALAQMIDGARLEVIADAGHLSNIEQPDVFNRAVNAFITGK
ncbi:alpha/beta fold hydrolase [Sphingomonas sp. ASV193]|uniref:alpha/beta fold hydrolase n=1 Tax=Sphingomonas sp. ASV193 TaxID=3144405 RepID=UPI0032E86428